MCDQISSRFFVCVRARARVCVCVCVCVCERERERERWDFFSTFLLFLCVLACNQPHMIFTIYCFKPFIIYSMHIATEMVVPMHLKREPQVIKSSEYICITYLLPTWSILMQIKEGLVYKRIQTLYSLSRYTCMHARTRMETFCSIWLHVCTYMASVTWWCISYISRYPTLTSHVNTSKPTTIWWSWFMTLILYIDKASFVS